MKKVLTITLILVLSLSLVSSVYGEESNMDNTINTSDNEEVVEENVEEPKIEQFSLEEAINYALENNDEIAIKDLEIKKAEVIADRDSHSADEIDDLPSAYKSAVPVIQRKMIDLGVTERGIDLNLNMAKWNKQIKENEIRYNVEKAYHDLKQAKENVLIAKEGLELANNQYEQGKQMYDLGTISKQELLGIELAVSQAQSGYDAAQMGYEMQEMSFNNTLGLDLDTEIKLTDSVEYKEFNQINLEEAINEAIENNAGLKVAKESYELSKLTLKATKAKYPENTFEYREKAVDVKQAAKSVDTAKSGVEMGVRSAYLSLTTAEKQIKTYEKAVEKAQRAYELAELSFELGQNTSNDVKNARINLMNAKNDLAEQIHAYNMALLDFEYSKGLGKTQIPAY